MSAAVHEPGTPLTLQRTLSLLRADLHRRLALEGRAPHLLNLLECFLHRGVCVVAIYRFSSWLHAHGFTRLAKIGRLLGTHLGKSEIHNAARIGPGLVVSDLGGIGIPNFAIIGDNCTFLGPSLLTLGGVASADLKRDHIVLGNHCVIGQGARLLGAIELGEGTQVKANSVVITSFPKPGQIVSGIPARRRVVVPLEKVRAWSPLIGRFMQPLSEQPCNDSPSAKPCA